MVTNALILLSCLLMASISTLTWNINGGHDSLRRYQILSYLNVDHHNDFCFLQETHSTIDSQAQWQIIWRSPIYFSHGTSNSAGVAILFPKRKQVNVISQSSVVRGRLLHLHVTVDEQPFHLVNVYAPYSGEERLRFFAQLKKFLNSINDDPVIMGEILIVRSFLT